MQLWKRWRRIMEIRLKEGDEIKVQAENGNSQQHRIIVCYQNCIITKQELEAIVLKH